MGSVLVLTGPLVDVDNPATANLTVSFEDAAKSLLEDFLSEACTPKVPMRILVLPSPRDVVHDTVYPQSPYMTLDVTVPDPKTHQLDLLCNPAQFRVNDISFAVSSYDSILPLSRTETVHMSAENRVSKFPRICEHLVRQRSFYPGLSGKYLDRTFALDLELERTPDLLITTSNVNYFALTTPQGTSVLNPRQLSRGTSGGG